MKKLIQFSIIGIIVIIALCVGSFFVLKGYLNSPEFPKDLSEMASKELRGELEVSDFNLKGREVSSSKITLVDSGKLERVQIDGFNTSLGKWAIFKRKWTMDTLECDKLHLQIGRKQNDKKLDAVKSEDERTSSEVASTGENVSSEEKEGRFYDRLIPNEVEFNKLKVGRFSGVVERKGDGHVSWENVEMTGKIKSETLSMALSGGTLRVPLKVLPEWDLIKARVIANTETYEVKDAKFVLPQGGFANLNGGGEINGGDVSATAELRDIPVNSLFENPTKHAELMGLLNGEIKVVSEGNETITRGKVIMNEGVLTVPKLAKPILQFIEIHDGNAIKLDQCTADITHVNDRTILENVKIGVGQAYQIKGRIQLDDDKYMVQCHLGVSYDLFQRLPDNLAAKYQQKGSLYWIPVNQIGERDDLAMDLAKKAVAELGTSILGDIKIIDKIGDLLGEDAKEFLEGEEGKELKEKGLKALENLFR